MSDFKDDCIDELARQLRNLSLAAQLTGGVAGRDENLCSEIDATELLLRRWGLHIFSAVGSSFHKDMWGNATQQPLPKSIHKPRNLR